jgi:hypothetical protein
MTDPSCESVHNDRGDTNHPMESRPEVVIAFIAQHASLP